MSVKDSSKRDFLVRAAIGGAAVVATTGAAKKVVSVASSRKTSNSDEKYLSAGDSIWQKREFLEMGDEEKSQQVQMFIENYKKQAV